MSAETTTLHRSFVWRKTTFAVFSLILFVLPFFSMYIWSYGPTVGYFVLFWGILWNVAQFRGILWDFVLFWGFLCQFELFCEILFYFEVFCRILCYLLPTLQRISTAYRVSSSILKSLEYWQVCNVVCLLLYNAMHF